MSVGLNPNSADGHRIAGFVLMFSGDGDEAIEHLKIAERLSPRDPDNAGTYSIWAEAAFVEGRYEEAVEMGHKSIAAGDDFLPGHRVLAAALGQLERLDEARLAGEQVLRLVPDTTLTGTKNQFPLRRESDLERFLDGLRKAGIPE